jgi:Tol biopolymer transport system component
VYPQASKVDPNVLSGLIVHDLVGNTRTVIAPSGSGPQWSPDGGLIAFVRGDSLFTITPEGEDETPLTTGGNPRWSPDGSRIAFVRDGNIWVIGRDGSGEAQLTTTGEDGDPNWSGNGGKIAFVSERDGNAEIYLMDADGGRQRNLTQNGAEDRDPDWRPAAP